ncbi:MAG: hypothetical protein ABSG84_07450 [Acidobacteriaceae bacterium]
MSSVAGVASGIASSAGVMSADVDGAMSVVAGAISAAVSMGSP